MLGHKTLSYSNSQLLPELHQGIWWFLFNLFLHIYTFNVDLTIFLKFCGLIIHLIPDAQGSGLLEAVDIGTEWAWIWQVLPLLHEGRWVPSIYPSQLSIQTRTLGALVLELLLQHSLHIHLEAIHVVQKLLNFAFLVRGIFWIKGIFDYTWLIGVILLLRNCIDCCLLLGVGKWIFFFHMRGRLKGTKTEVFCLGFDGDCGRTALTWQLLARWWGHE